MNKNKNQNIVMIHKIFKKRKLKIKHLKKRKKIRITIRFLKNNIKLIQKKKYKIQH